MLVLFLYPLLSSIFADVNVSWCTVGTQEQNKCWNIAQLYKDTKLKIKCVTQHSESHCLSKIAEGAGDGAKYMRTVDGGTMYDIYQNGIGTKLILAEDYGMKDDDYKIVLASYYAVAVVRANSSLTFNTLKGARSCHTGYGKTSGWNIPVGSLSESGMLDFGKSCDVVGAVEEYFSEGCVPDDKGKIKDSSNMCRGCSSGGCSDESLYQGYSGAFRCLVEGHGDVAFVKHSTVFENSNGARNGKFRFNVDTWAVEHWANNVKRSDYRLLCLDGRIDTVDNFVTCNLALVPAHGLIIDGNVSEDEIKTIQQQLTNPPYNTVQFFSLFKSEYSNSEIPTVCNETTTCTTLEKNFNKKPFSGKDLLFKDSTTELVPVLGDSQRLDVFMGEQYLADMKRLNCQINSAFGLTTCSTLLAVLFFFCVM